jgi:gluconokinase
MTLPDRARPFSTALIFMGVSGCGKSTVAALVAQHLGWPMIEGDDLHPPANIAKMTQGIPLDDDDRRPCRHLLVAAARLPGHPAGRPG